MVDFTLMLKRSLFIAFNLKELTIVLEKDYYLSQYVIKVLRDKYSLHSS